MRTFSKSKLLAYRQCTKRLWLELKRPELREESDAGEARLAVGRTVGEIARRLYDPKGRGVLIDVGREGQAGAIAKSRELLTGTAPLFEAGFSADGALVFADVILPVRKRGAPSWRLVEVKSSTSVKGYHRDEAAIQAFVVRRSGVPLAGVAVAHIDSAWVYPGNDEYQGLLVEEDVSGEAAARESEVEEWIGEAQAVAAKPRAPRIGTGAHCEDPYPCVFLEHCRSGEKRAEYPVDWLPGPKSKPAKALIEAGITELRDMPDDVLTEIQRRVKKHTLSGKIYFDNEGAAAALLEHKLPAHFLDFETIQFAVPIWKGTRPYQMIPFQFSVHRIARNGALAAAWFLDLSGADPSSAFAKALIPACGERGAVFVYNAGFEKTRIKELAERFPRLKRALLAINDRIVDLWPVTRNHYYHPSQAGSWSIKRVLPTLAADLSYDTLDGVQDGNMAMTAYLEAIHPRTAASRKAEIREQLLAYCELDTLAMVHLWKFLTGQFKSQV